MEVKHIFLVVVIFLLLSLAIFLIWPKNKNIPNVPSDEDEDEDLDPTKKTYIKSINGDYLIFKAGESLMSTQNKTEATPVYLKTWNYSPEIRVYLILTEDGKNYITMKNRTVEYQDNNQYALILYSKTKPTLINMVGMYVYLGLNLRTEQQTDLKDGDKGLYWQVVN